MNAKTLFLIAIFIIAMNAVLFAQVAPIDFETGGYGADWTWTVFENSTNPPVQIISNPQASGINTSATVAEFTALYIAELYGLESETFEISKSKSKNFIEWYSK